MKIELDTNNITPMDLQLLAVLTGGTQSKPAAPAPSGGTQPKAAPKAPVVEPEPVVEDPSSAEAGTTGDDEDLLGGAPTMADAVKAATDLVAAGQVAKVREALAGVGAKKVSEMTEDNIPVFLAALA